MTYIRTGQTSGALPREIRHPRRIHPFARRDPLRQMFGPRRYTMGDCNDLGFSLKPPRKVRKFIAKHKTALLVGAGIITAGFLAPGALLAVGRGALTAGKVVGRGALRVGRQAVKLFPRGGPFETPGTFPRRPTSNPPPSMPDLTLPGSSRPPAGSGGASDQGGGYGGGGYGGGAPSYGEGGGGGDTPDSAPADAGAPPAKPAIPGGIALAGVGLLALMMMSGKKR